MAKNKTIKMSFKDAPTGARFKYPLEGHDEIYVKMNSFPESKRMGNDGRGLIVSWNGNIKANQSHCGFTDEDNGISFDTEVELV